MTGNINWHLPFAASVGDVELGANVSFKSRIRLGSLPASGRGSIQPAYAVADALLRWNDIAGSNFNMTAYVKNMFDQFYKYSTIDIVGQTGVGASVYAPPRTYGMTVG